MARNLNMTEGKPLKLLFSFAVPLMFGNLFQQLYTVVDTAIVGKGVGMTALAALGSVDWLNWMLIGIAQGFSQGFSVRIAQKFGEKDEDGLRHALGHAAKLCAIIAIICLVIAQAGLPLFLKLLRVPAQLAPIAKLYTRMIFSGLPVVMLYNFCAAALRAVGDSKTPLIAMICASIVNIILDCIAVFALRWGVAGAAAATLISQCISALVCILRMGHTPALRFQKSHLQADPQLDRILMRIGTPVAVKNIIVSLGGMVISSIVNGFSLAFIAGFTATNKLYGLLEIAALSYGFAITTYIGQNYGAGHYQRIRHHWHHHASVRKVDHRAVPLCGRSCHTPTGIRYRLPVFVLYGGFSACSVSALCPSGRFGGFGTYAAYHALRHFGIYFACQPWLCSSNHRL